MPARQSEKIPREAVWIMAVYVGMMVVGVFIALLVPLLLHYDGPTNGSITLTPPPALSATPSGLR
jgi:hypothetical protein